MSQLIVAMIGEVTLKRDAALGAAWELYRTSKRAQARRKDAGLSRDVLQQTCADLQERCDPFEIGLNGGSLRQRLTRKILGLGEP